MSVKLQILLIISIAAFFVLIIRLLKKRALELKYTILWIITGVILLIIGIFPSLLEWLIHAMGVYSVVNGLFAIALFFTLLMLLSITSIVSKLSKQNKELAQNVALLEKQIREGDLE